MALQSEELSDAERHFVKDIADVAMIRGWESAIQAFASSSGVSSTQIKLLLNKAAEYNDKADPHGRIPELEDWKVEKRGRSEIAASGPGKSV